MKLKDGFMLKNVAGSYIIVPVGGEFVDLNAMISVNETGAFLWNLLQNEVTEENLTEALVKEYDVKSKLASEDVTAFIKTLTDNNMLII